MADYNLCDVSSHALGVTFLSELLSANVEFGVMQSDGNCVNIGICRIVSNRKNKRTATPARSEKRRCPTAKAFFSLSPDGRLQAFFPRAGMMACTQRAFFRAPVFPVPVPYFLPESFQNDLPGLKEPVISAGLYPIRTTEEGFFITF